MKKLLLFALAFFLIIFNAAAGTDHSIETKTSKIEWKGHKASGSHSGTLLFKEGNVTIEDGKITAGEVVVDMNTLKVTDLKGEWGTKLEGHLKAADLFDAKQYPTASLKIKSVLNNEANQVVTADLNMHGKTHEVTFEATVHDHHIDAKASIKQFLFGITYTGKSDDQIKDGFDLNIHIDLK